METCPRCHLKFELENDWDRHQCPGCGLGGQWTEIPWGPAGDEWADTMDLFEWDKFELPKPLES